MLRNNTLYGGAEQIFEIWKMKLKKVNKIK